jgi:hypothetical protein
MSWVAGFRNAMHREPIIIWSFIIGGVGAWMKVHKEEGARLNLSGIVPSPSLNRVLNSSYRFGSSPGGASDTGSAGVRTASAHGPTAHQPDHRAAREAVMMPPDLIMFVHIHMNMHCLVLSPLPSARFANFYIVTPLPFPCTSLFRCAANLQRSH